MTGFLLWLSWVLGAVFPDSWWGTHFGAFLPRAVIFPLMALSLGGILWPLLARRDPRLKVPVPGRTGRMLIYLVTALVAAWLAHQFPIRGDNYGNSVSLHQLADTRMDELPAGYWRELLSPGFEPGKGREQVFLMAVGLARAFHLTIREAYLLLDAVCGGLYVFTWLLFSGSYFRRQEARWLFRIVVLSAPMLLVFFGHLESYAVVLLLFSGWVQVLLWYHRSRKPFWLGLLALLWYAGTQSNGMLLLLLPVMGWVLVEAFVPPHSPLRRLVSMKGMLYGLFLPMCLLGLAAYFFVFRDHRDPRVLDDFRDIDRLFLPLFSPDPPLDRYNLLSFNHLFDLLQVLLFSAPVALLVLGALIARYRRRIRWNDPSLVAVVFGGGLISAMLFMVNPLFSLPMDWDLFSIVLPAVLGAVAVLLGQLEEKVALARLVGPALGLGLMLLPVIGVNHDQAAHPERLERVGLHVFKTYYIHADRNLLYALNIAQLPPDEYLRRKSHIIHELRPHALPGNDPKFAALLLDQAIVLQNIKGDLAGARDALREAATFQRPDNDQVLRLMELHFRLGEFGAAHEQATELIRRGAPSRPRALRMGIHTALEAEMYEAAAAHCAEYLALEPADSLIAGIARRLASGDRVEELKELFSRGD